MMGSTSTFKKSEKYKNWYVSKTSEEEGGGGVLFF